mgnify:CR=1 FL=1
MPRGSRIRSNTGIYHCMLRGVNKQNIFLDNQDRRKFLKEMERVKEKYKYQLYTYCLMPNHVHLLIKEDEYSISKIIHSISTSYSNYFNKKYERVGHLFQDRFASKPVESEEYLISLHRYIHRNPEKAGIEKTELYIWSSYSDYVKNSGITDTSVILEILKNNNLIFEEYNSQDVLFDSKDILEYEIKKDLTDSEAIEMIKRVCGIDNIMNMEDYNVHIKRKLIDKMKTIDGINNVQISRITGINKRLVERGKK